MLAQSPAHADGAGNDSYETLEVADGRVTVFHRLDGTSGIRCETKSLRERVVELCKARQARWMFRSRFWVMPRADCDDILSELRGVPLPQVRGSRDDAAMTIRTSKGHVQVKRLNSGAREISHVGGDDLDRLVALICETKGQWDRTKAVWIVPASAYPVVEFDLRSR